MCFHVCCITCTSTFLQDQFCKIVFLLFSFAKQVLVTCSYLLHHLAPKILLYASQNRLAIMAQQSEAQLEKIQVFPPPNKEGLAVNIVSVTCCHSPSLFRSRTLMHSVHFNFFGALGIPVCRSQPDKTQIFAQDFVLL